MYGALATALATGTWWWWRSSSDAEKKKKLWSPAWLPSSSHEGGRGRRQQYEWWWWWWKQHDDGRRRMHCGTLVDAMDEESVVVLVRVHSRGVDSTDELMQRLVRTFVTFPPSDRVMQRLSYMHQRREGQGGVQEFSLATAHAAAMMSLMR